MRIKREDWIFITGQAGSGKTLWMQEHIKKIPFMTAYIYDFNHEYMKFEKVQNIWKLEYGNQAEIEEFLRIVYQNGNCITIFDESDNYFVYDSEILKRFVNTARNRGIGSIVNAKRPKAIRPVFRNRFTHLVLFRISIPEDIEYLESWSGFAKGRLSFLRNMEVGEHVVIDLQKSEISDTQKLRIEI